MVAGGVSRRKATLGFQPRRGVGRRGRLSDAPSGLQALATFPGAPFGRPRLPFRRPFGAKDDSHSDFAIRVCRRRLLEYADAMVEPATMSDAEAICGLVNYWAERGRMLHRSLESVYLDIRDFLVWRERGQALGCVAIAINWKDLAEIRSLAVAPEAQGRGIGVGLMRAALEQARALGLKRLFALTYEQSFFTRLGFKLVDKDTLPTKVWRDCLHCPRADNCEEAALVLEL